MQKKYIVRLTDKERQHLEETIKKLSGSGQRVRRAQILLKADADKSNWTDRQIAEAFSCRTKTVENIRQQLVLCGFQQALDGKQRERPPIPKLLGGGTGGANYSAAPWIAASGLCQLELTPADSPGD